jgi:acyl-CoA reductase-like NAD-dependent aldehyde dehydrogenase
MMAATTNPERMRVVPLWINGEDQPVNHGQLLDVIQSATNKTVHYAHSANEADAKAAVDAAAAAFVGWSKTPLVVRRDILLKAADLLDQRALELDAMQMQETCSPPQFGAMFAKGAAATIKEVASLITTACSGAFPPNEEDGKVMMVIRQPVGPVLIISPWNSPTYLGPRGIANALAAGCTIVLKASELCPETYHMLCQVFADAGVPAGALNQIVVRREDASKITEAIIADRRIRKVEFIGSAMVGSLISQMCGKHLKPILLELGGKCPAIICKDADLENAAKGCVFGAFLHHGQICMSTERIIVVKEVAERFSQLLKTEVENWAGLAGTAATQQFCDRAFNIVKEALDEGAELFAGDNTTLGETRTALRPTIVTNVQRTSRLYGDESFGPSATLYVVDDEDKAVELANDSGYGLVGAVWSSNTLRALNLAKRVECGSITVNGSTVMTDIPPTMFTQATKGSGWGAVNGVVGIQEFLNLKAIILR